MANGTVNGTVMVAASGQTYMGKMSELTFIADGHVNGSLERPTGSTYSCGNWDNSFFRIFESAHGFVTFLTLGYRGNGTRIEGVGHEYQTIEQALACVQAGNLCFHSDWNAKNIGLARFERYNEIEASWKSRIAPEPKSKVETLEKVIFAHNLHIVKAKVEKFDRKAQKLGFAPAVLTVEAAEPKPVYCEASAKVLYHLPAVKCSLTFTPIKIEGFTFCGTVDFLNAGNIIREIEEGAIPTEFRETTCKRCDHCGHKRQRKQGIILKDEGQVYHQIGSSCSASFLGVSLQNALTFFSGAAGIFDEEEGAYPREPLHAYTKAVLATSAFVRRVQGWVSAKQSREAAEQGDFRQSGAAIVQGLLFKDPATCKHFAKQGWKQNEEDTNQANQALTYWLNQVAPESNYVHNLQVLLQEPVISMKQIGIVASAVPSYLNKLEREAEKAREKEQCPGFFGELKERYKGQLAKVTLCKALEGSYYGGCYSERTLLKFELFETGHSLTWFASCGYDIEEGETVELDFTVKEHNEWRGTKSTVITRANLTFVKLDEKGEVSSVETDFGLVTWKRSEQGKKQAFEIFNDGNPVGTLLLTNAKAKQYRKHILKALSHDWITGETSLTS